MAVGMTFQDISAVLAEINKAATGQDPTSEIIDTSSFVSVAEATLRTGYDNLLNAISQVFTRTIFAVRPYRAQMLGLEKDGSAWGNHVRKINYFDSDPIKDTTYSLPDDGGVGTEAGGDSVDQWIVERPKVLQTNYYGQTNYARMYTMGLIQLNAAFQGPDQLADFWSGMSTHMANQIEQDRENLARMLVVNRMAGMQGSSPQAIIYLLDEYNAETGLSLTSTSVFNPANFPDFARYAFARINDVSDMLRARTIKWHQNWTISGTDYNFMRNTPYDRQHLYLSSRIQRQIGARVLADTFNSGMLKYRDMELVPYWQTPDERETVLVKPVRNSGDGNVFVVPEAVKIANIVGVLFDEDAIGYTPIDSQVLATPVNARSRYINFWYHYGWHWYNDFTENAVLFLLTSSDITNQAVEAASLKSNSVKDHAPTAK